MLITTTAVLCATLLYTYRKPVLLYTGFFLVKCKTYYDDYILSGHNLIQLSKIHTYEGFSMIDYSVKVDDRIYDLTKIQMDSNVLDVPEIDSEVILNLPTILSVVDSNGRDLTFELKKFIEYYDPDWNEFDYIDQIKEHLKVDSMTMMTDELDVIIL